MKAIPNCVLLLVAIGSICGHAHADGKFFGEEIPPDIPYQRAFILFHEGSETLVLQSKYDFSQSAAVDSLGWVVPVPSVPEIDSVDAVVAKMLFFHASFRTKPKLYYISSIFLPIFLITFLGGIAILLLCLVEYPFLNKIGLSKSVWLKRLRNGLITVSIALFLFVGTSVTYMVIAGDVEVIKAEKAGIYDVKVVRSQSAEGILGWLKENGFGFDDSDV